MALARHGGGLAIATRRRQERPGQVWQHWMEYLAASQDYKAGTLIEKHRTSGEYLPHVGYTLDTYWLRLSPFGEQFYRENRQQYREPYPEVEAPAPGDSENWRYHDG